MNVYWRSILSVTSDMTSSIPSGKSRLTLDITQDRIPVLLFSESGEEKNGLTLGFGEEEGPMLQFIRQQGEEADRDRRLPQGEALQKVSRKPTRLSGGMKACRLSVEPNPHP
jgi:hypothetical protein